MKLVNYVKNGRNALGVLTEKGVIDAERFAEAGAPVTMRQALELGREGAAAALANLVEKADAYLSPDEIEYAPAVDDPEKILCVGKNYAAHAAEVPELFKAPPGSPEIFAKYRNALVGHGGSSGSIPTRKSTTTRPRSPS